MDVSLVMFKSDGTRRDFALSKDRTVLGRTNGCDLRIPLSSVSRKHCEIALDGDAVRLRDLGSSNGTYHNTVRVQEATLEAGDEIVVGPVVFTIVIDGEPSDIRPVRTVLDSESDEVEVAPQQAKAAAAKSDEDEQIFDLNDSEFEPIADDAAADLISADDEGDSDASDLNNTISIEDDADVELIADPSEVQASANKPAQRVPQSENAEDEQPQELPLVDDDGELPDVDEEMHTPTVDLDDPIAALQAMADDESDDSGDLPMLLEDDDKDKKK